LLAKADELGIPFIATGHYANITELNGAKRLAALKTNPKSQEYFLALVSDDILTRLLLPLSSYTKDQVRAKAREIGLAVSDKKDSQEVCFIPDGDYAKFIQNYANIPLKIGDIITADGTKVFTHNGFYRFTIGQRKGIGIGMGVPHYVIGLDAKKNQVIIGPKEQVYRKIIRVSLDHSYEKPVNKTEYLVKIRYRSQPEKCQIIDILENILTIEAEGLFHAPTPGQLAVFYNQEGFVLFTGEILE
jgi:tRNA-specific 2-thiouridylase